MSVMAERIPGAEALLLRFGSDQVRNQGSIGGNIGSASPIGDLPPLLLALDSTLLLQKGQAIRELPLEAYYLGYRKTALRSGEFIRAIRIPLPEVNQMFSVHKVSKRSDDDISSVCAAFHLPVTDGLVHNARIAFGGMAATPIRAKLSEECLNGRPFAAASVADAQRAMARELKPLSDARASAGYRLQVAQNLLQRVLLAVGD
jgi:xanthine dehydrogenase small subunit